MRLLLNTHVFLWYIAPDPKLPRRFRAAIEDPSNDLFLSIASVWEAVIKHQLGKLPLPFPPADHLPEQRDADGMVNLPIDDAAMPHLARLPSLHRDPFDRTLVAQALQHGLTIVTVDPLVSAYPVPLLPPR